MASTCCALTATGTDRETVLSCDYENLGFACDGDGYLRLGAQHTRQWPCPKCNTAAFLQKSFRAANERLTSMAPCICCGPGLSHDEVWSSAIKVARACNPAAADAALLELALSHVRAFRAEAVD
jgi:hypothetical protein